MSGALSALAGLSTPLLQAAPSLTSALPSGLSTLLLRHSRSFGGTNGTPTIIPDVVIEETETNRVTITQHPVATGSPINDHIYRMPANVTMRCGWTNANPIGGATSSLLSGDFSGAASSLFSSFTEQRVNNIYKQLLKMQFDMDASGDQSPVATFQVTTGKKTYDTMVISELQLRTDRTSEYALMLEVHFQEIIKVKASSTSQPAQTDQSNPSQTASPTGQGTQTATSPATDPNSIAARNWGTRTTGVGTDEILPGPGQ